MPLGNIMEFGLGLITVWSHFWCQTPGCRSLVQLPSLPVLAQPRQFWKLGYCTGSFHPAVLFARRCHCLCLPQHKTRDVLKDVKRSFVQSSYFQKKLRLGFCWKYLHPPGPVVLKFSCVRIPWRHMRRRLLGATFRVSKSEVWGTWEIACWNCC